MYYTNVDISFDLSILLTEDPIHLLEKIYVDIHYILLISNLL